jgi:hypothetical protein
MPGSSKTKSIPVPGARLGRPDSPWDLSSQVSATSTVNWASPMLTTGAGGGVVGVAVVSDVGVGDGDSAGTGEAVGAGAPVGVGVAATTVVVFSGIVVGEGSGVTWAKVLHARVNKAANNMAGNFMVHLFAVYLQSSGFSRDITTCKKMSIHDLSQRMGNSRCILSSPLL